MRGFFVKAVFAGLAAVSSALATYADVDLAELFGRAAGVSAPKLSPSGSQVAIECAPKGQPSLCIFDLTGQASPALLGLDSTYRLKGFDWVNEQFLVFTFGTFERVQTVSGMRDIEFFRAVAYDTQTGKSTMLMSDNRSMVNTANIVSYLPQDQDDVLLLSYFFQRSSSAHSLIPEDDADSVRLRTYKSNLKTGKTRRAEGFSKYTEDVVFNRAGKAVARLTRNPDIRSLKVYHRNKVIYEEDDINIAQLSLVAFDEGQNNLVVWIEAGESYGLNYMSLETGEITPILVNGRPAGGAKPMIDERTRTLIGLSYGGDFEEQVFLVPELEAALESVQAVMPGKHVRVTSWTDNRQKVSVAVEAHGRPAEYYVYDNEAGTLGSIGNAASHLASRELGSITAVSYIARDGMEIPGYLTLPPGKTRADGPFPMILLPHGGPTAHDNAGFDWWSQAYAEAGYAVLRPNYRGSDGYSAQFMFAGHGEYGGKMVDDVVDGAAWAAEEGISNGRYCIAGGSYGGYSALMVAARDQENVACVISVNGLTDPIIRLAEFDPDGNTYQEYQRLLGVDQFASDEEMTKIRPVAQARNISAPVLIMHGREDTRVPFKQFILMQKAAAGQQNFSFVELEGEDHFLLSSFVRTDVLRRTLAFLSEHNPVD